MELCIVYVSMFVYESGRVCVCFGLGLIFALKWLNYI